MILGSKTCNKIDIKLSPLSEIIQILRNMEREKQFGGIEVKVEEGEISYHKYWVSKKR